MLLGFNQPQVQRCIPSLNTMILTKTRRREALPGKPEHEIGFQPLARPEISSSSIRQHFLPLPTCQIKPRLAGTSVLFYRNFRSEVWLHIHNNPSLKSQQLSDGLNSLNPIALIPFLPICLQYQILQSFIHFIPKLVK